jgi:hypothetical protein
VDITPDKRKLVGLVEQGVTGKLCLPDFQRDFVWPRDQIADLLRSIIRGYYVGSLLLLRCHPERPPFAPTLLRGVLNTVKTSPDILVLDGQQRLTSLVYALTAPDLPLKDTSRRRRFFIDLDLLVEDNDDDEIVFDRHDKDLAGLDRPEVQYEKRMLPCTVLMRSQDFLTWRDGFEDWLREHQPDNLETFRKVWRDDWTKMVNHFQNFEAAVVELPVVDESDPTSISRVCAIFEKLNSGGVELSVYDLLTARLYPAGIKLHDLWDESCRRHKRLNEWSEGKADTNKFGVLVLRTLALLRDLLPTPSVLIRLESKQFETDWHRAAKALERALELLELVGNDGFGVFARKWLPGFGFLPILAALYSKLEELRLDAHAHAALRRWYWCSVFLERYSSAVETKSRKDYLEMLEHWTNAGPEPAVFAEAQARIASDGYTIRDSASSASSVYSGVFCLLAMRGARDWRRAENIQLQILNDHHIFPQAYLKRHGITKHVNSVLNRTLIGSDTNQIIKDLAPSEYLQSAKVFPSGATNTLLDPHFLPGQVRAVLLEATETSGETASDVYDRFLRSREVEIVTEIRRVCGVNSG